MRRVMFSLLAATLLAGAPMGFACAQGMGGMGGGSDSTDPGAGAGGPPRAGVSSAGGSQKGAIHPGRSDNPAHRRTYRRVRSGTASATVG
jgi:hypothetical protein